MHENYGQTSATDKQLEYSHKDYYWILLLVDHYFMSLTNKKQTSKQYNCEYVNQKSFGN